MADDKVQTGTNSGVTPPVTTDPGSRSQLTRRTDGHVSIYVRWQIYFVVTVLLAGLWIFVLSKFGYTGTKPALVGLVLGIITFMPCRSYFVDRVVDRFFKVQPAQEVVHQPVDNVREIIETVVFVVVLVLLLKSFVAEAFQIPTGSMAETLYGYQKEVKCPTCDYRFPVNASEEMERPGSKPIVRCVCPNCLQKIQTANAGEREPPGFATAQDAENVSGDRVLVAKFLYDLFNRDPDRLDVVVFKFPGESNMGAPQIDRPPFPGSGPYKGGTQMNYIKRLIGLPGEAIAIYRGKLYVLPANHGLKFPEDADEDPRNLWRYEYMHHASGGTNSKYEKFWNDPGHPFQIIRKRPENILAMKRIVYDQDFTPRDEGKPGGSPVRWSGWTAAGKGFTSAPSGPGKTEWLRYAHILRSDNGVDSTEPELITDFMAYNDGAKADQYPQTRGDNWVGDLILETEVEVAKAEGELVLELCKGIDRFQARFDLTNGNCKILRLRSKEGGNVSDVKTTELGQSVATAVKKPGTYRLRFANVDQRLTVWVDKDLPFGDGVVDDDNPYQGGPVADNDLQPASIGAVNAQVTARSMKLFRDTYYTATGSPADVGIGRRTKAGSDDWKTSLNGNMPILFMYVQDGHFLCLGDNSPHSSDGRSWGLVPRRLMLGRALLIYFPFWPFSPVTRIGRIE